MSRDEDCPRCGHPFDPHLFVATGKSPLEGGVIVCQEENCDCLATWSAQGTRDQVRMPDEQELAEIRATIRRERT